MPATRSRREIAVTSGFEAKRLILIHPGLHQPCEAHCDVTADTAPSPSTDTVRWQPNQLCVGPDLLDMGAIMWSGISRIPMCMWIVVCEKERCRNIRNSFRRSRTKCGCTCMCTHGACFRPIEGPFGVCRCWVPCGIWGQPNRL